MQDATQIVQALAGLLLIAAGVRALTGKLRRLPFPIALVIAGVALQGLSAVGVPGAEELAGLEVAPEVIFYVFLPILVFESAFNMDQRALRENIGPVLTLAVPGLALSTLITGALLYAVEPLLGVSLGWPAALLLGALLSATDPVGVTTLFKQIGAPRRLSVLVEGESLFNDATSIVLSGILTAILIGSGTVSIGTVGTGLAGFLSVFLGGVALGWALAVVFGFFLGKVDAEAFIEISLTTVLAWLAFTFGEDLFGVSGVMAAVTAGLVIGGWGRTKISPSIRRRVEEYWNYLSQAADALLFLLVGLIVDVQALAGVLGALAVAIVAMVVSRAAAVYGLVPLIGRLPGQEPVDRRYQTVMWWGGLRGGIALAIALSLPEGVPGRDELFIPLAMGAVLFTLLVQGLTVETLVKRLRLDVPSLPDRVARLEGLMAAKRRTLKQVPLLVKGGLFSPRVAERVQERCGDDLDRLKGELDGLREARELNPEDERRLLYLRCFAEEKDLYYRMFSQGHLSESAYRKLTHSIELQTEAIRHEGRVPEFTLHPPSGERLETVVYRLLAGVPGLQGMAEQLRSERTARDYEIAWTRSRGSRRVLEELDVLARNDASLPVVVDEVRAYYQFWQESARSRLDQTAEQFPEFVTSTQQRLADRIVLHAEREAIEERAHSGIIPDGVASHMLEEMARELRSLRASEAGKLRVEPGELLRKVPFFEGLPEEEFAQVASRLRRRTAPSGEVLVRQGSHGDSLFLVARGVIRVSRQDGGHSRDLATLMSGDFFGEMALIAGGPRTATCRAVTPCALYELRRADLDAVLAACPTMQSTLVEATRVRRSEQLTHGGPLASSDDEA